MQENQIRKNTARTVIHNHVNNYPYLIMPKIINEEDEKIYEVLSTGFHTNDAAAMIKTEGFATTRANTPIATVENTDGSIQVLRLPLELEY